MKYINEIRHIILQELQEPNDDFVRYFAKQVYPNMLTAKVLDAFRPLVKRTFANVINDTLNERLKSAITPDNASIVAEEPVQLVSAPVESEDKILTTAEELEAFYIVRSILRPKISVQRISYRDAQSYFAILLDDNNRKPVCRLYLNSSNKKYIATFDADKKERKIEIKSLDDIYNQSDELEKTIGYYL